MRGLDGNHGVMIPIENAKNLNLNDNVVDAVKDGKFHIYAIQHIDEGIEILTGVPAGEKRFKKENSGGVQLTIWLTKN